MNYELALGLWVFIAWIFIVGEIAIAWVFIVGDIVIAWIFIPLGCAQG